MKDFQYQINPFRKNSWAILPAIVFDTEKINKRVSRKILTLGWLNKGIAVSWI